MRSLTNNLYTGKIECVNQITCQNLGFMIQMIHFPYILVIQFERNQIVLIFEAAVK